MAEKSAGTFGGGSSLLRLGQKRLKIAAATKTILDSVIVKMESRALIEIGFSLLEVDYITIWCVVSLPVALQHPTEGYKGLKWRATPKFAWGVVKGYFGTETVID